MKLKFFSAFHKFFFLYHVFELCLTFLSKFLSISKSITEFNFFFSLKCQYFSHPFNRILTHQITQRFSKLTLILVKVERTLETIVDISDSEGYFKSAKSLFSPSAKIGRVKSVSRNDFFGYCKFSSDFVESNNDDAHPAINSSVINVNRFAISPR